MGNSNSPEIAQSSEYAITSIFNYECPILDIGNNNGVTGYLDFINPTHVGTNNVMKGTDSSNRPFIVIKAEYYFPDETDKKTINRFEILLGKNPTTFV